MSRWARCNRPEAKRLQPQHLLNNEPYPPESSQYDAASSNRLDEDPRSYHHAESSQSRFSTPLRPSKLGKFHSEDSLSLRYAPNHPKSAQGMPIRFGADPSLLLPALHPLTPWNRSNRPAPKTLHLRLLLPFLLLLLIQMSSALPSFPQSSIHSVYRRARQPDVIVPSICPSPCQRLFSAYETNLTLTGRPEEEEEHECLCECPVDKPVYLHVMGYCVHGIGDCVSAIAVEGVSAGFEESPIPVVELPLEGSKVISKASIVWSEELHHWFGLMDENVTRFTCSIPAIYMDTPLHRWTPYDTPELFTLVHDENRPQLLFSGTARDVDELKGVVIQLKVDCLSEQLQKKKSTMDIQLEPPLMCMTIRIAGEFVVPLSFVTHNVKVEVLVLSIIAVVLLFALCGSAALYKICWNIQKQKLIGDIQMQCMYHIKGPANYRVPPGHPGLHPQQPSPLSPSQLNAAALGMHRTSAVGSHDEAQQNGNMPTHAVQKRRLYFSTEYFDREYMLNPPAVAEQFLFDLRRMIDLAKDRIKARKHHQRMHTIYESPEPVVEDERYEIGVDVEELPSSPSRPVRDESPRSGKSSDSGRETLDDSSPCSSDEYSSSDKNSEEEDDEKREEEEEGEEQGATPTESRLPLRNSSGIPVPSPPKVPPKPQPSLIPTLKGASPRLPPRPLPLSTVVPPLSGTEKPISSPSGPSKRRHDRRKGYAVFPVDPMVNKSLPRRPRRVPPTPCASTAN